MLLDQSFVSRSPHLGQSGGFGSSGLLRGSGGLLRFLDSLLCYFLCFLDGLLDSLSLLCSLLGSLLYDFLCGSFVAGGLFAVSLRYSGVFGCNSEVSERNFSEALSSNGKELGNFEDGSSRFDEHLGFCLELMVLLHVDAGIFLGMLSGPRVV